jgi:hypothetical protein
MHLPLENKVRIGTQAVFDKRDNKQFHKYTQKIVCNTTS